jgi:hypothetical protein
LELDLDLDFDADFDDLEDLDEEDLLLLLEAAFVALAEDDELFLLPADFEV